MVYSPRIFNLSFHFFSAVNNLRGQLNVSHEAKNPVEQKRNVDAQSWTRSLQEYSYYWLLQTVLRKLSPDRTHQLDYIAAKNYVLQDLLRYKIANETGGMDKAFYMVDLSVIVRQFGLLRYHLPHADAQYNVSVNADPVILKVLAAMGVKLRCSSKADVVAVHSLVKDGYDPIIVDVIPCKPPAHLKALVASGARVFNVDSRNEVERIARVLASQGRSVGDYSLTITIKGPSFSGFYLGASFDEVPSIVMEAEKWGLSVKGLAIDLGHFIGGSTSPESEVLEGLLCAASCVKAVSDLGHRITHVSIVGFEAAKVKPLKQAIAAVFPLGCGVLVCVENTDHLLEGSITLTTKVIGKRAASIGDSDVSQGFHYYLDDGCYGSFGDVFTKGKKIIPKALSVSDDLEAHFLYPSTLWGPTCDGLDCVNKMTTLPELEVGDWLYVRNIGSMTISGRTNFNGLGGPTGVYCFSGLYEQIEAINNMNGEFVDMR